MIVALDDAPQEPQPGVDDGAQLAAGHGGDDLPRAPLQRAVDDVGENGRADEDEGGLDVVAVAPVERLGCDDEGRHAA